LAVEATSEAFALACDHWAHLENPPAWVWVVSRNCLKRLRKRQSHEVPMSSLADEPEITAEDLAVAAPAAAEMDPGLIKAIADLSPRQRAVMAGRYILDLRPIDVARALGITPQAESEYHRRALLTLRERLADWRRNE
jgi:RNA polymerase sigma factor (sigma-70 family)